MWIVVNALLLYNIAVRSGRFDAFRHWVINHLPNDRRVVLVVIGFCFGALLEGVAGFGTPVAITSSLLILVGFPALEALVFVLIFNTAPVAFGALGVPVTVLGAVTGLPATALGAMIGRQLPVMALFLPFYVMSIYGGLRSARARRVARHATLASDDRDARAAAFKAENGVKPHDKLLVVIITEEEPAARAVERDRL